MTDWKDRIRFAFEAKNKKNEETKTEDEAYKKQVRETIEKIVKPAFKELIQNYPGEVSEFHIEKSLDNPCLINGSIMNQIWRFCISFQSKRNVLYTFNYFENDFHHEGVLKELNLLKKEDILETITTEIENAVNPPTGSDLIAFIN